MHCSVTDQFKTPVFAVQIGMPGVSYGKIKGVRANAMLTLVQCRVSDHRSIRGVFGTFLVSFSSPAITLYLWLLYFLPQRERMYK